MIALFSVIFHEIGQKMPTKVSPRGWSLIVWIVTFTIFLVAILVLRLWAALIQKRSFRLDDGFILVAYVCGFCLGVPYAGRKD